MNRVAELCTDCGARQEERSLTPSVFGGDKVCRPCENARTKHLKAQMMPPQGHSVMLATGCLPWWLRG